MRCTKWQGDDGDSGGNGKCTVVWIKYEHSSILSIETLHHFLNTIYHHEM